MGVFSISMFNLREGILVTSPFQDHKKPHQTTGWTTKNSMLDQRTWDSNPLPVTVASKGSCHSFIGIPYKKMCKGLGGDCFWEGGHRKITWFFKHIRTMNLWAYKIACSFSSNTPPNKKNPNNSHPPPNKKSSNKHQRNSMMSFVHPSRPGHPSTSPLVFEVLWGPRRKGQ